jgi:hypothetical protein
MRWWQPKRSERDLERELVSHLELEAEERREAGLSPGRARLRRAAGFRQQGRDRGATIAHLSAELKPGTPTCDGKDATDGFTVSIMEFRNGKVIARDTVFSRIPSMRQRGGADGFSGSRDAALRRDGRSAITHIASIIRVGPTAAGDRALLGLIFRAWTVARRILLKVSKAITQLHLWKESNHAL